MATSVDDFVWYAPKNHFYYLPTGERWVKTGVEASIGKDGIELVKKTHMVSNQRELVKILKFDPYDRFRL